MKQILLILLLTALIRPLPGQNLPSRACNDPYGHNRYWFVFSDRENNPSYTQPGGTGRNSSLHFLERFLVAEKNGEYLHIYKDPGNTTFPQISTMASSYGWIHEDFLLLENRSETIAVWAMNDKKDTEPEQKLYKDPAFTHSTGMQLESFDLLYVHKKAAGAVLLAGSTVLRPDPENPEAPVAGWYPSSQVEIWKNRFVLEPNWETAAYQERQTKDLVPAIFSNRRAAEEYFLKGEISVPSVLWMNEPGAKRNPGSWKRFPILEIDDHGICTVRVFKSQARQNDACFSHQGFTCVSIIGNTYPIYKASLFLSGEDLSGILSNLQKLVIGHGSMSAKRRQLQTVYLDILEAQLGSLNREEFLSYTLNEISEIVNNGIPMQSNLTKNLRLMDITDPTVLSDVVFGRYMNYLENKVSTLRIFLTEGYEQSFFSDGNRYYWVPVEDFP